MTSNLTRDRARRRSASLDVLAYEVEVDVRECVDPAVTTYPTRSTIRITCSVDETFLDFLGESVDAVEVNGRACEVEYDGARVTIRGLVPDAENVVTVRARARYSRSGEGLHRYVDPADGLTYLYTQYEPADARRVFVDAEQPDLKSRFTFVVTAPSDWEVLSNSVEVARQEEPPNSAGMPCSRRTFAPTPPMSTYVTCLCVGPYARFDDVWTGRGPDGAELTVPIGMWCRRSLVDSFDADALLATTKRGLDFFHEAFAFPYPWGKYDSIFVPEYNLGAMENPGLVTFSDAAYVFQSGATASQREARSNTMLHEMAHMWFGDLVTPAWWDDLWLKESFADYMGTHANAVATEFTDAWTPFCARRKAWAYRQDQLPTTHPIVADIPDVEAAKQNFDGITYAKGASVLKQLVSYVGQDAFLAGSRTYFARHAFSTATLDDLLDALAQASGRDLGEWARLWLTTTGTNVLTSRLETDGDRVGRLTIEQEGEPLRPHRLVVGLYSLAEAQSGSGDASRVGLTRTHRLEVDVAGAETVVEEAAGVPRPDLVLVNDDDLTYAKVRVDEASLAVARDHLADVGSSLSRACLWSALWNACRDGRMPAARYLDVVLFQAPRESHVALQHGALLDAATAIESYAPAADRAELRRRLLEAAWEQVAAADPGSGAQLTWARALARAAGVCGDRAHEVRELLDGSHVVPGLPLLPELRWQLWTALAASGHATLSDLRAELDADPTSLAPVRYLAAASSLPTADVKARVWDEIFSRTDASNDEVQALVDGFSRPGHGALVAGYRGRYFAALDGLWTARSQEIAQRVARGLFPSGDLDTGARADEHPVVVDSGAWLDTHPDAPGALRRLVLEGRDHLLRALRAQAAPR
ncbi:aminopeptidase N [Agilicoccus flavus]|uniref:aminopeptidase N n=1 Tax=Agilicoccus flavus TaxID=2775968 RepID=UPI001CF6CDE9|nr:aminopeptidase N [Agilicoccus flavus]